MIFTGRGWAERPHPARMCPDAVCCIPIAVRQPIVIRSSESVLCGRAPQPNASTDRGVSHSSRSRHRQIGRTRLRIAGERDRQRRAQLRMVACSSRRPASRTIWSRLKPDRLRHSSVWCRQNVGLVDKLGRRRSRRAINRISAGFDGKSSPIAASARLYAERAERARRAGAAGGVTPPSNRTPRLANCDHFHRAATGIQGALMASPPDPTSVREPPSCCAKAISSRAWRRPQ